MYMDGWRTGGPRPGANVRLYGGSGLRKGAAAKFGDSGRRALRQADSSWAAGATAAGAIQWRRDSSSRPSGLGTASKLRRCPGTAWARSARLGWVGKQLSSADGKQTGLEYRANRACMQLVVCARHSWWSRVLCVLKGNVCMCACTCGRRADLGPAHRALHQARERAHV